MAYSDQEVGAAKAVQDWLNAGNQWGVDMLGWDWFFSAWPEYAPYRDIIVNHRPEAIAQWDTPAPTPTPAPTQTQTQTQTQASSNTDPYIGKIYQRIQDIPEGYEWTPTQMFGTPMTNKADILATIAAADRGELTDYQKQFTYQVTQKKPEGVLTQEAPGLYSFTKDGKEYIYSPKDFVKYGAFGQENVQSTSPEGEPLNLGKKFTVNPLLQSKELLDKATKTNIDPKQYQIDFSNSGITDPTQGYVWRKQDYINTVNSLTGGAPTAYNYNPSDALTKGQMSWYPEQYGTFQGRDENGNYVYRQGRSTTTFNPKTGAGSTYTPGDSGFGDLMPILGIIGLAIGAPFLGELGAAAAAGDVAAGEALGGILAEGGFGELSAAELANLGYDASWADALGGTGLEAWDGYQPPSNWETADMSPFETPPTAQPTTTPTEAAPNLEGGDLGNAPPNLEGGDLGNAPPNLEGGDLGMTEAEWQDQFYKDIGIDPASLSDLPPATTAEIESLLNQGPNVSLSDLNKVRQMVNISKLLQGAGLLGGTAVAAKAAQGLLGGLGGGTGAGAGIQAPKPFTGTYSGSGPTDPAYFQQIQQNYNRLFPANPADVATPLQSWYQTKFVPDTNISNKLFGV